MIKKVLILGLLLNFVPLYDNHNPQTATEVTHWEMDRRTSPPRWKGPLQWGRQETRRKQQARQPGNKVQEMQHSLIIFTWTPSTVSFLVCSQLWFLIGQLFAIQMYSNYFLKKEKKKNLLGDYQVSPFQKISLPFLLPPETSAKVVLIM